METNVCSVCGKEIEKTNSIGTGYGYDGNNNKVCYQCCGEQDKQTLIETGKLHGYLVCRGGEYSFCNWPNTFSVRIYYVRKSWHNFAGKDGRRDFWFTFNGANYHGVNIGDNECATVKRTK